MAARPLATPPAAVPAAEETVHVNPGMAPDTVMLTTFRHDGRPFLRIELPSHLAADWVPKLEKYTIRHDDSKPSPVRLVV